MKPGRLPQLNSTPDDTYYRYNCSNWSPDIETVTEGQSFSQTATDCKSNQYAKVIAQEKSNRTGLTRTVGDSYTDKSQINVLSQQTSTQSAVGTKGTLLRIKDPVAGVNGVYQINDGRGGTFNAYVNMTDNGGNWILIARWTNKTGTPTSYLFNNVVVKNQTMLSFTNDPTSYPAIPSNKYKNPSSQAMFMSGNSSWISSYGSWQAFSTFSSTATIGSSGFSVSTPSGSRTMYAPGGAWNNTVDMSGVFGLWPVFGNSGPCGGAGREGTNKICPYLENIGTNSHFDITSTKYLYLKATN